MKSLLAAVAALGLLSAPQMATAADSAQTIRISVSTEGLDLTRPSDVQRLRARISDAAIAACDPADRMIVTALPDYKCRREALASVEPTVQHMAMAAKRKTVASSR